MQPSAPFGLSLSKAIGRTNLHTGTPAENPLSRIRERARVRVFEIALHEYPAIAKIRITYDTNL